LAGWEEFFVDGRADGIDRLVDDLAEAELEGDEAIDHAAGGVAGRGDDVFTAFDDGLGVAVEVRSYDFRGFDEGIFDAVDADFAIVLGGVAVAATKEGAGGVDGEVAFGTGVEFADIEVATEVAGGGGCGRCLPRHGRRP